MRLENPGQAPWSRLLHPHPQHCPAHPCHSLPHLRDLLPAVVAHLSLGDTVQTLASCGKNFVPGWQHQGSSAVPDAAPPLGCRRCQLCGAALGGVSLVLLPPPPHTPGHLCAFWVLPIRPHSPVAQAPRGLLQVTGACLGRNDPTLPAVAARSAPSPNQTPAVSSEHPWD